MDHKLRIWLVNNEASGSNDAEAFAGFEAACEDAGVAIAHRTIFPKQELPSQAVLAAAEIDIVTVFAGDGTINAVLQSLEGWSGAVLVLRGGTMNLLYHRLFGDMEVADVLKAVAQGKAERRRPGVIEAPCGRAYAGILAGPGTAWVGVREAMREGAPIQTAAETGSAISETLAGERLRVAEPALGKEEGYPLVLLTPQSSGMVVDAYHAETASAFIQQTLALVKRDFREGPHDRLGQGDRFVLASVEGGEFGVLLDGEPCPSSGATEFRLVPCPVDLLATLDDD